MSANGAALTREDLLRLGQSSEVARFIPLAAEVLAEHPGDADLRVLLIRRLVEWGLFHRAAAVADGFPPEWKRQPDIAGLIAQLAAPQNNGLADWDAFQDQYEANLEALRRRYDWVGAVDAAWRQHCGDLELHRTSDGRWLVYDRAAGPSGRWRPSLADHRPEQTAEQIRSEVRGRILAPIVIAGVGLGDHLPLFHDATDNTMHGASPILYQVESDWLGLAVVLHLRDWGGLISSERVVFCVGPDACERLERAIQARRFGLPPRLLVAAGSWQSDVAEAAKRVMTKAQVVVDSACARLRRDLDRVYGDRDLAYWHRRFKSALSREGPPLRVLGMTSRFTTVLQYSMRDTLAAFEARGCETRLLIEPDDHSYVGPQVALETLQDFEPDLVFLIDHTRRSQRGCLIDNVPLVTWVQDRLPWLFDRATGQAMGPLDFCMGQSAPELIEDYAYPPERFMPCDMATNPDALLPGPGDPSDANDSAFACDAAFATHASETPAAFHARCRDSCADACTARLLDALFEEMRAMTERGDLNGALHFDHFVSRVAASAGLQVEQSRCDRLIAEYARPLAERFLRHQTIAWVARWAERTGRRFHLYGQGWDRHPSFGKFARGTVRHGPDLGRAFRAARINLHASCNHALHQRVLDGLTAGGFFLIRKHGADVSHRVSRAVYAWIRENDLQPGVSVRAADLPEALRAEARALRRMNGRDPDAPLLLTKRHFDNLRALYETGEVLLAGQLWPRFEEIVFSTAAELEDRLEWFLSDDARRTEIAAAMREAVVARFSYTATVQRLLVWLVDRMRTQSVSDRVSESRRSAREGSRPVAEAATSR